MNITKQDTVLANCCAKGEVVKSSRKCVGLKDGYFVASNGFLLVCCPVDKEPGESVPNALLPASIWKTCAPPKDCAGEFTIQHGHGTVTHKSADEEVLETIEFPVEETDYPDYQKMFGSPQKTSCIAIDIKLLKTLLSALPPEGVLKLGITGSTEAIEFMVSEDDRPISGIIMPMHVDWASHRWHSQTEGAKPE